MTTIEQLPGLGYEGIYSFCRFPLCFDYNEIDADVAVVGVCLDTGTTNRSGTRYGPKAIREGSMIYSLGWEDGFFDVDLGKSILKGVRIIDCGDIPTPPTLMMETFGLITQGIKDIRSCGTIPVVLGGDHSISFPVVQGFSDTSLHVIHFDAHLDMMDDDYGMKYTHGNPMKRITELEHVTGLTQIGIRGLLNWPDWEKQKPDKTRRVITARDVQEKGLNFVFSQIPADENIYISVDIDSLDPSVAPGTGTPEFGGLTYLELVKMLRTCVEKGKLVGLDLVEVNPLFDPTGRTAQLAARLIIDVLGAAGIGKK